MELLPTDPAIGRVPAGPPLPPATRAFGKILSDVAIQPGDLLLTRPFGSAVGWASRRIVDAQRLAYHPSHAQWTHAAICVGDGRHVVEANFLVRGKRRGVMSRLIQEYADGKHALRVRRPKISAAQRNGLPFAAATHIKKTYDFSYLVNLAWHAYQGRGLWDENHAPSRISPNALVCSSLYSDALLSVSGIKLGGPSNRCLPALLASSDWFDEVELGWLDLEEPSELSATIGASEAAGYSA